jgi:hypothetical protein
MFVENALVYLEFNPIIELIFLYKLGNEIDGDKLNDADDSEFWF